MHVELFYSPGCTQCDGALTQLKAAALQCFPQVQWRECNVLEALDRAVELGVLSLPALAVNGDLLFPKLPTPQQLCAALEPLARDER